MRIRVGVLFVALLLLSSCAPVDKSADTNRSIADRFTEEGWNAGNVAALDEFISPDFVRHNPPSADPPEVRGLDALKEYITGIHGTYPDFHVKVHSRLAEGDLTAGNWTVTGTNAENGVAIEFPGITISRFQDGKVTEEWVSWDTKGVEDQLAAGSEKVPEANAKK
jgi:predicted SnoaL-like aldol condensation-catalyzing enzyme